MTTQSRNTVAGLHRWAKENEMTKIEIAFTDEHAKRIRHYLQLRYKSGKAAKLEKLCCVAILTEVAASAKAEAEDLTNER